MRSNNSTTSVLMFIAFAIFQLILILLKMLNVIQSSWNIVLIPVYLWLVLAFMGLIVGLIIGFIVISK